MILLGQVKQSKPNAFCLCTSCESAQLLPFILNNPSPRPIAIDGSDLFGYGESIYARVDAGIS